jgi:hypothetical protein
MKNRSFVIILVLLIPINLSSQTTYISTSLDFNEVNGLVALAVDGDTIILPEGQANWTEVLKIGTAITLQGQGKGSTFLTSNTTEDYGIEIKINSAGIFRMTELTISNEAIEGGMNIREGSFENGFFIIDNCHFQHCTSRAINVWRFVYGLISNCTFENNATSDIAVYADNDDSWLRISSLGTEDAVYIEDCTFNYTGDGKDPEHSIASNDGARYVFRYNTVTCNTRTSTYHFGAPIDVHGNCTSGRGAFSAEIYQNTIISDSYRGIHIRGGEGVIYENYLYKYAGTNGGINIPIELNCYRAYADYCTTGYGVSPVSLDEYPVIDQIQDLYIWDNYYEDSLVTPHVYQSGLVPQFVIKDRDYFEYEKPGYIPLTYPHPKAPAKYQENQSPPKPKGITIPE